MNNKIKDIVRLSFVAALYVVMTILWPLSYDAIQFRISEILIFLCFFRKDYSIALILGCFISNLFSDIMLFDIVFGTIATALTCVCVMFSKNIYVTIIYPILFNSVLVGMELFLAFNTPLLVNMAYVAIGEAAVILIGLLIFIKLRKNNHFMDIIGANQNL